MKFCRKRHLTFFLKSLGGVYDIFYCLIQNEINRQSRGFNFQEDKAFSMHQVLKNVSLLSPTLFCLEQS